MYRCFLVCVVLLALTSGCSGVLEPATLVTGSSRCAQCQRPITNTRVAAQLLVPGEPAAFFDDIECLGEYLQRHTVLPRNAIAYVVDHGTGEWTLAATAVYSRNFAVDTPTGSHLLAHASRASRDADPAAQGGAEVSATSLFPLGAPDGTR
ncbi:MAG: hypothetical protein AB1806_15365 [Acidobacteriota bacterium]